MVFIMKAFITHAKERVFCRCRCRRVHRCFTELYILRLLISFENVEGVFIKETNRRAII